MLQIVHKHRSLRRDALKVISFAMTSADQLHSLLLINETSCLSVLFGYLMKMPSERKKKLTKKDVFIKQKSQEEIEEDLEHCLSIIWFLIKSIGCNGEDNSVGTEQEAAKINISLERLCFKFLEQSFQKLDRVLGLHKEMFTKVEEFDLG